MKYLKKIIAPALIIIFSLFVFAIFKVVPSSKLWKGYTVFYVQSDCDTKLVESVLNQHEIKDFIALENQFIPLNISSRTPEVSLAVSYGDFKSDYLNERKAYFFDKSRNFKIYYIPEKYNSRLNNVNHILQKDYHYRSGINASSAYPFIVPVICLLFAIILILYSEKKIIASSVLILPVFFSFFVPLYASASSICLLMYAVFFSLRLWKRDSAFNVLLKNPVFISFCTFSFLLELFSGIKCTILFVILLCAVFSMIFLCNNLESLFEEKRYSFIPVKIRSAYMINLVTKKSRFVLLPLSACAFFTFVFAFFSININFDSSDSLVLPGAVSSKKVLPDLNDYTFWRWEALSSPYISLNDKNYLKGSTEPVYFSTFEEDNGKIIETVHCLVFDDKFKAESVSQIELLNYPSIEKLLKKQGKLKPGFSVSGKQSISFISLILIVISVIFPLIFYFFITKPKVKAGAK